MWTCELESTGPSWCEWSLGDDRMELGSSLSPHSFLVLKIFCSPLSHLFDLLGHKGSPTHLTLWLPGEPKPFVPEPPSQLKTMSPLTTVNVVTGRCRSLQVFKGSKQMPWSHLFACNNIVFFFSLIFSLREDLMTSPSLAMLDFYPREPLGWACIILNFTSYPV